MKEKRMAADNQQARLNDIHGNPVKSGKLTGSETMKNLIIYGLWGIIGLASCQRELHFPPKPVLITIPEKIITAIIIYNPTMGDYDSVAYHYSDSKTTETHYERNGDSVMRTFSYDAAGRLSSVEDEEAIYYTNTDRALRIRFEYNTAGQLLQTITDFTQVSGVTATIINKVVGAVKQIEVYDTAYKSSSYNLDWVNRVIYSSINSKNYILYDSSILTNTSYAGLVNTIVSEFSYESDTVVKTINRRVYFNHQLSESGTVNVTKDSNAPVFTGLRKKLYRNLSNWFQSGEVWQDNNYNLFPLPGGPYKSILYSGLSISNTQQFTRNYDYENNYSGDDLENSKITYTLSGQGSNSYVTFLKFYYGYQ